MAKILVIDDNNEVRENLEELLGLYGYETLGADDGKLGVKLAKEEQPDLIVCDIMMPGLDGYGVLNILGQQPETSVIPFIFLTAKSESSDMRKGMNMGADDYITKPFEETVLLEAVKTRLEKSEKLRKLTGQPHTDSWQSLLETTRGIEKLKEIGEKSTLRRYRKKEMIFQQDDRPLYLYHIVDGKVKLFKSNADGKEMTTALLSSGDYFGYDSLLKDDKQIDSAETLEDSQIRLIPREEFLPLIFSEKDVSAAFIKLMSNDIVERERHLLELAYNTVRKRVADALVKLHDKYAAEGDRNFTMSLSRDDLASIVGTSTESAIRMLSEFKAAGFIDIKGSDITVIEVEKLRKAPY